MTGKDIVVIGVLAAGAYLLLGRSGALGGGVEGGNGKKATAITGIISPNDGGVGSTNPTNPTNPTTPAPPGYNTTIPNYGNITTPFEPSPYLISLITQKYAPVTPAGTKKEASIQYNLTPISGSLLDTLGSGQGAIKYIPSAGFVTPFAPLTPYQQLLSVSKGAGETPTPVKKDIIAVPYYGFNAGVFGTNSNAGFTPAPAPTVAPTTKKVTNSAPAPTKTPAPTKINSPVKNVAPSYSGKKYGGWGG